MTDTSDIRKTLREFVLQENSGAQVEDDEDYESPFSDVGIDSLDVMMVTLKVTEKYGVEFGEDNLVDIESLQDIVDLVQAHKLAG